MNWKLYHRLNDIYEYLYFLQKHYPDLAEVINIGDTVEGRPMLVLKIGSRKFSDKPAIFIEGGTYSVNLRFFGFFVNVICKVVNPGPIVQ